MIARAVLLSGQQFRNIFALNARAVSTSGQSSSAAVVKSDESNLYRRPVRQEAGKVRLGFIPEEFFTFFYKKTGVTGPYTFAFTFTTYLISKELFVLEHEYYNGISMAILCVVLVKMLGPAAAAYLDKEIDKYEESWVEGRKNQKIMLSDQVDEEQKMQWSFEGQNLLMTAKRENVDLQLEAAYRQRFQTIYEEVKKRLDYQVEIQNIERRIAQRNLIDWIVTKVRASITPAQEKRNLDQCIADLGALAKA